MNTLEFLSRVLPPDGSHYFSASTTGVKENQDYRQTHHTSVAELAARIDAMAANQPHVRRNIYFGVGSFTRNSRTKDACALKACHHIDIDSGDDKPYASPQETLDAIKAVIGSRALPMPTLILCSGYGIHAYWCLSEPVAPVLWQPVAEALKNACKGAGLETDEDITTDAARILRPPNTLNFKSSIKENWVRDDAMCRLLGGVGPTYTNEQLASLLGTAAALPAVDNSDLSDGLSQPEYKPLPAGPMLKNCGVFNWHMDMGGANAPPGSWYNIISTLSFTADGEDYIHPISEKHATYVARDVDKRFSYAKSQHGKVGPTTCAKFEECHSDICALCPHKGTIKSPIQLTTFFDEVPMPFGYYQDEFGLRLKKASSSDEGKPAAVVMPYRIVEVSISQDPTGAGLRIQYKAHHIHQPNAVNEVNHEIRHVQGDSRVVSEDLARGAIALTGPQLKGYKDFIMSWMQRLQGTAKGPLTTAVSKFGWTSNGSFAAGDVLIHPNGKQERATVRADGEVAKIYTTAGSLEPWRECCDYVVGQKRQELNALIASAFAAPLLKFTPANGVLLSLYSKESGTGKTTAMQIAQGVWGDPREGVHAVVDTENAIANKMGILNNLPAYWDELRTMNMRSFVGLIFQVVQGREKARLGSNAKARPQHTWQTMLSFATNESILDYVGEVIHSSDAGIVRVFELPCSPLIIGTDELHAAQKLFNQLPRNYGHAGRIYAGYLACNHDAVVAKLERNIETLWKLIDTKMPERFRFYTMVTLITGAQLSNEAGLTKFDVPALMRYLVGQFLRMRGRVAEAVVKDAAAAHMREFLRTFADSRVIVDARTGRMTIRDTPKKAPLAYQITVGPSDVTLTVASDPFLQWAKTRYGIHRSNVRQDMLAKGFTEQSVNIGSGTGHAAGASDCFVMVQQQAATDDPYALLEHTNFVAV